MKNLKTVSDSELIEQIRRDAAGERKSGLAVIHQLKEISRRRLDSRLGYRSLHKYCMEDLKYSSGSAWRRIKAMEALEDLPEIEEQIAEGALTLASLSQVQNFCEQKGKTVEEKKGILEQVSGLSKRETEKALAALAPEPERPEKLRELDGKKSELRVTLDAETVAALDKIRDLIAHARPGASYAEVIADLAKLGLKKLDPAAEKGGRGKPATKEKTPTAAATRATAEKNPDRVRTQGEGIPIAASIPAENKPSRKVFPPGKKIPAATRRLIWQRDGGRCGYTCPDTGRVCGSTALLQPDHIVPRAKGGGHEPDNLRLRCRRHNLLAAIDAFGEEHMGPYLRQ